MTIKWGRVSIVICDTCDEMLESERLEPWELFWKRAKEAGWRARHVRADEWTHGCPKHEA